MSDNEIINRDLFDFQQTERSAEEISDIIVLCKKNSIDYSPNSFVWSRTKEEIEDILKICRENNINLLEENYLSKNGYIINADIFKFSPEDVQSIISFCDNNNISYVNNLFSFNSIEEIQDGFTLCQKIDVDFSCFRGEEVADAYRINIDGIEYVLDKTGKKIITVYGAEGEVTIPSFVEEICENAFLDCEGLKKISIPGSVKKIGEAAFKGCTGLLNVEFSQDCSLEEIANSTFEDCEFLHEFNWPNNIKIIGEAAFKNTAIGDRRRRDTLFVIPDTVEIIRESAFENCINIERLVCPSSLRKAKRRSFAGCTGLKYIGISPGTYEFDDTLFSCDELDLSYCGWSVRRVKSGQKIGFSNLDERARNIQMFCKSGLELYSYYKENPQELPKRNNVNPLAIQQTPEDYLSYVYGDSSITNIEALFAKELSEIIVLCSDKSLYDKVLSRLNVETFVNNANFLINKLGVKREKISELIVSGNHYNLLSCSIEDALNNYQYLCDQKIVSRDILRCIFFNNLSGDSAEDLLIDFYKKNGELPDMFNSLLIPHNCKNKQELRDRLVYVSTMHLLDEGFNYSQIEQAKDKLKFSLIDTVINRDKSMFIDSDTYSVIEDKYPKMRGIMYALKEKLMGIDEQWYYSLLKEIKKGGTNTVFDEFYNSLTVVQNWDKYNEIQGMTLLKNEIVGRLLYSDIFLTCIDSTDKGYDSYLSNRGNNLFVNLLKFASKERDDLFFNSNNLIIGPQIIKKDGTVLCDKNGKIVTQDVNVYSQIGFILTMLEIDPYSFDALRMPPGTYNDMNQLENLFAIIAKERGYLFSENEKNKFNDSFSKMSKEKIIERFVYYATPTKRDKKRTLNDDFEKALFNGIKDRFNNSSTAAIQKTFSEFMSNIIGTARIPKDMEGKYLDYVRESAYTFLGSKSINDLYGFCSSLDLYLRSKSEYDIQTRDKFVEDSAREVFDRNSSISDDARIIYSLHNLNRLAHDVVEIDLKSVLDHKNRLDVAKSNTKYKELSSVITAYNDLFHMGFNSDDILRIIDPRRTRFDRLKRKYALFVDTVSGMSESDKNRISVDSEFFEVVAEDVLDKLYDEIDYVDSDVKIDYNALITIMNKLEIIKDKMYDCNGNIKISEEDRDLIDYSIKAKSYFFEAKKLFAQEIMRRMARGFSDNFVNMLNASPGEKINFYANNGYIAEIQYDENQQDVLVCLCEEFNEPFSIHLKDMPKDISDKLKNCSHTATITHARLDRRGLTLRDADFENDISSVTPAQERGFVESQHLLNAISSNYINYDLPASRLRLLSALRQDRDTNGTTSTPNIGSKQQSNSELEAMLEEGTNNASGANTNTGGNKHQ